MARPGRAFASPRGRADPQHDADAVYHSHGELLVPIENIGAGPALDLHLFVTQRDENGGVSPAWGEVKHTGAASGLAVSKTTPVEVGHEVAAGSRASTCG